VGNFLNFEKYPVVPLLTPGYPVVSPLHLTQIFPNWFLPFETDYFDEGNGFQQFSESLELVEHFLKTYERISPFANPVVPTLHFTQIFQNLFLSVETDYFEERNGFREFSESLE
jgi:hypothetical protein